AACRAGCRRERVRQRDSSRPNGRDRRDAPDAVRPPGSPAMIALHRTSALRAILAALALTTASALPAQSYPDGKDARDGLGSGLTNAGVAMRGMRLVATAPKPVEFDSVRGLTFVNSDLAFRGNYVYQGNFAGFSIWDVSNP